MVSKIQFSPPLLWFIMIPPNRLSTIAQKYNPDLLNEWLDALIRQYSYALFFSLKDKVLKAETPSRVVFKIIKFGTQKSK